MSDERTIALVENARKGKEVFEQLVRRCQHDVFRIVRVYTKNDAEDLAQEMWIKIYQSLGQLKDSRRFSSWLETIAVNTTKD